MTLRLLVGLTMLCGTVGAAESFSPSVMTDQARLRIEQGLIAPSGSADELLIDEEVALVLPGSWENTPVHVDARVDALVRFMREGESTREVTVSVVREGESVVVRSDHPGSPDLRGGLRVRRIRDRSRRIILRGASRSTLVIAIPPAKDAEHRSFPVALCFREKPIGTRPQEKRIDLFVEPLKPVSVAYEVRANARGEFFSGMSTGYGRAEIAVTENIPPSKPAVDETRSQDPSVDIGYFPGLALHGKPVEYLPLIEGRSQGGIRSSVLLRREAGGELRVRQSAVVEVLPVQLRESVPAHLWGETYIAESGECTLVVFSDTLEVEEQAGTPLPSPSFSQVTDADIP